MVLANLQASPRPNCRIKRPTHRDQGSGMVCAVTSALTSEVETRAERYLERSKDNAVAALRPAIFDPLVDAVE